MPKASRRPAWLEVSAGGRRLCRIRNLLQEGHWMAAGKTALDPDTTVWGCDGWKHTGPPGAGKRETWVQFHVQTMEKMFPPAHLGRKGTVATQAMFYWLKHSDLMWHKHSRMFPTSAWWNFSWKRKRKINQMPVNTANQHLLIRLDRWI